MREEIKTGNKAEKNKKENRAALKKFIPMLIVCAVIGGITGGVSSFIGYSDGGYRSFRCGKSGTAKTAAAHGRP